MAAPNIVAVTTITGRVVTVTLGTAATDIVANGAGSNKVFRLGGLIVANPTSDPMPLSLSLVNASPAHTASLVSKLVLPGNASLRVPVDKINLEEGDKITGIGGGVLQATATFEEIG